MDIKKIIKESIQGYNLPKKKGCSCGCNTCHTKAGQLNEAKERVKKLVKKSLLKEETTTFLYKLEGLLVTNTQDRNQTDILSDIRSISGVTIVSSKEYNDSIATDSSNYKTYLTIKIDPHPFIGKGGFGKEQLKLIYNEVKKVIGVKAFQLKKKPERIG